MMLAASPKGHAQHTPLGLSRRFLNTQQQWVGMVRRSRAAAGMALFPYPDCQTTHTGQPMGCGVWARPGGGLLLPRLGCGC
jgi:hypothetical protein